jgi:hypothetical protein
MSNLAHQQALCDACGASDLLAGFADRSAAAIASGSVPDRAIAALSLSADLIAMVKGLTREAIERLGGIEAVKQIAGNIYDSYIAPIDIPGVPNLIEGTVVDPMLRRALMLAIDAIYAMGS